MRRLMIGLMTLALVAMGSHIASDNEAHAGFSYNPAGDLVPGSGQGKADETVHAPGIRFPIEETPAFANSQVWGHGGAEGPAGGECHSNNYSYPWYDNFCETRWQDASFCPGSGDAHQGQDIRPSTCDDRTHWVVSATDGTVTSIGSYTVWIQDSSGMTHRYMHMAMDALEVQEGQSVSRGQRLGLVSNDFGGTPTTIHLHYDINQGGTYLNPYMSLVASYEDLIGDSDSDPAPEPEPEPDFDIAIDVHLLELDDFYADGSSQGVVDAFSDDRFEVEVWMTNHSEERLGATEIGISVDEPFGSVREYSIYSDHPDYDQNSWSINSADPSQGSDNPANLGGEEHLEMHGFAAGETKRVVMELEAGEYSIGQMERSPEVRAWLTNATPGAQVEADVVFSGHDGSWDGSASQSVIDDQVRSRAKFDVLSRDQWLFESRRHEDDLEGWDVCYGGHHASLIHNQNHGALSLEVDGDEACVVSPDWTRIDADRFDEMVIEVRAHNGWHTQAVYWGDDQGVMYDAPGDGAFHQLVVPLGDQQGWTAEIDELRLKPMYGAAPESGDNRWHDIGEVYFQNSSTQETSSQARGYSNEPPVDARSVDSTVGPNTGQTGAGTSPTGGDSSSGDNTANIDTETSACSTVGGGQGDALLVLLAIIGLVALRRREG